MSGAIYYRQLEICWVNLEPTRGAETRKKRPCVIVQSDIMNRGSRTVIVAPLLPGHKTWSFVVNIKPTRQNGLDKNRHVNLKQLRSVDRSRIENKQGVLETDYLADILSVIGLVFGMK